MLSIETAILIAAPRRTTKIVNILTKRKGFITPCWSVLKPCLRSPRKRVSYGLTFAGMSARCEDPIRWPLSAMVYVLSLSSGPDTSQPIPRYSLRNQSG